MNLLRELEPTISAVVGLLTLCAALWGGFRLIGLSRRKSDTDLEAEKGDQGARPSLTSKQSSDLKSESWFSLMNLGVGRASRLEEFVAVRTVNVGLFCLAGISLLWLAASLTSTVTYALTTVALFAFVSALLGFAMQWNGNINAARWILLVTANGYWMGIMLVMGPMVGTEYFLAALLILPVLVFGRSQAAEMLLALVFLASAFTVAVFLSRTLPAWVVLPDSLLTLSYFANAIFLAIIIYAAVSYYKGFAASSYHELLAKKQQNDEIVSSILPERIVQRIEKGEKPAADWHPESTILFALIGGFSELYSKLPATELVEQLSRIYSRFDEVLAQHDVDKIKTLGMTYVAATGIGGKVENHHAIASCALAMQRELEAFMSEADLTLSFRCGIATGVAISGVIADMRPRYDIWGEALESAAHMQARAPEASILVNETAFWRLNDSFDFSEAVKGRDVGRTESAYRLLGERCLHAQPARVS